MSRRILILGAAGRDFHDFNLVYRDDPSVEVVAFTAAQIPGIAEVLSGWPQDKALDAVLSAESIEALDRIARP